MSESIPKRKIGDEVQVMNTDDMQERGLANKRGRVIELLVYDFYMIRILGGLADNISVRISGDSLRAWVVPLKEDLT